VCTANRCEVSVTCAPLDLASLPDAGTEPPDAAQPVADAASPVVLSLGGGGGCSATARSGADLSLLVLGWVLALLAMTRRVQRP